MIRSAIRLLLLVLTTANPSTRPAGNVIGDGKLRFTPPADWKETERSKDTLSITWKTSNGDGTITIVVIPKPDIVPDTPENRRKMAEFKLAALRALLTQIKATVTIAPRVEDDKRFGLRIRNAFTANDQAFDQLHLCRVVEGQLVLVTTTALTDVAGRVAEIHREGEDVLASVRANEPQARPAAILSEKPTVFAKAGLRLLPPDGWQEQITDQANGGIAAYRNPLRKGDLINVFIHRLPDAKREPAARKEAIDLAVKGEGLIFRIEGEDLEGKTEKLTDSRFLRKVRAVYETKTGRFVATNRQIIVGDTVLSISAIGTEDSSQVLDDLSDKMALAASAVTK